MSGTFWITDKDLDAEQAKAVQSMPEGASFLVRGPAGSGKTNILLLRAKWFKMKGLSNFKIISFTASLRDFIRAGCVQCKISPNVAVTCVQFFRELLGEYRIDFDSSGNFEADRSVLAGKAKSLVEAKKIPAIYDAILVDECQDYMDTE